MLTQSTTTLVEFKLEGQAFSAIFAPESSVGSLTVGTIEGLATVPINRTDFAALVIFLQDVQAALVDWPVVEEPVVEEPVVEEPVVEEPVVEEPVVEEPVVEEPVVEEPVVEPEIQNESETEPEITLFE